MNCVLSHKELKKRGPCKARTGTAKYLGFVVKYDCFLHFSTFFQVTYFRVLFLFTTGMSCFTSDSLSVIQNHPQTVAKFTDTPENNIATVAADVELSFNCLNVMDLS